MPGTVAADSRWSGLQKEDVVVQSILRTVAGGERDPYLDDILLNSIT